MHSIEQSLCASTHIRYNQELMPVRSLLGSLPLRCISDLSPRILYFACLCSLDVINRTNELWLSEGIRCVALGYTRKKQKQSLREKFKPCLTSHIQPLDPLSMKKGLSGSLNLNLTITYLQHTWALTVQ